MRLRAALLLPFALVALLLVGCGGDDGSDEADETTTESTEASDASEDGSTTEDEGTDTTEEPESTEEETTTTPESQYAEFCERFGAIRETSENLDTSSVEGFSADIVSIREGLDEITLYVPVDLGAELEVVSDILTDLEADLETVTTPEQIQAVVEQTGALPALQEAGALLTTRSDEVCTPAGGETTPSDSAPATETTVAE